MSFSIVCHGCAGRVQVPDGYARKRLQCPECGVLCDVPPPERRTAAPEPRTIAKTRTEPEAEALAEQLLLADEPAIVTCGRCERRFKVKGDASRWTGTCPECRAKVEASPAEIQAAPGQPAPRPKKSADVWPPNATSEEDGNPYAVVGGEDRRCSNCSHLLEADDVLVCPRCSADLRTGKKPRRSFEPLERHWVAGWTLAKRVRTLIVAELLVIPLAALQAYLDDYLFAFVFIWLLFTAMLFFLLGTFDRLELARDKRGRVRLSRTWRVCFVPQPTDHYDLAEFEGLTTGKDWSAGFWEWVVCVSMLGLGIVPGILWYYFAIARDNFFVALTRDHGFPAGLLYKGGDEEQMWEIARTVSSVAELPLDGEVVRSSP